MQCDERGILQYEEPHRFMPKIAKINLEKPGRLIYTCGNYEYTFPCYEENSETIVVDTPTLIRIHLFFGWYTVPLKLSSNERDKMHSHLIEYFKATNKTLRFFERPSDSESPTLFYPELFEQKGTASRILEDKGFVWLSDYTAIDILHNEYGLEICGISDERKAEAIAKILSGHFVQWHYHGVSFKEYGPEPGRKFSIHMFPKGCQGRCADDG